MGRLLICKPPRSGLEIEPRPGVVLSDPGPAFPGEVMDERSDEAPGEVNWFAAVTSGGERRKAEELGRDCDCD